MWPDDADLVDDTLAAERLIEAAYTDALNRWAPHAESLMLPSIDFTDDDIEPDPHALHGAQASWDALVEELVIPVVVELWTQAATSAVAELDPDEDVLVASILGKVTKATRAARSAAEKLNAARGDFVDAYRRSPASLIPGAVRAEVQAAVNKIEPLAKTAARKAVREAMKPGSVALRKVAKRTGFHGASVLNHAAMAVAKNAGDADRKMWVATLDERTRDSHWAADSQVVDLNAPFRVGVSEMEFPGDPSAPPEEIINCRCRLSVLRAGESPKLRRAPRKEAAARAQRGVERGITAATATQEDIVTVTDNLTDSVEAESDVETFRTFTDAVIAFIGKPTSDNRLLKSDINLIMRSFPHPLMWMRDSGDGEGHTRAFTVGVVEAARVEDDKVLGSGYMLNSAEADEAVEQLRHKVTRPSVDLGGVEWALCDQDGVELTEDAMFDLKPNSKVVKAFSGAELMGTTLVSTPAFGDTYLTINDEREPRDPAAALAASVELATYPAEFFSDPMLPGPTRPTMSESGRVYGHLAEFGHPYRGGNGEEVPRNFNGYTNFHTSQLMLDNGKQLAVGRLTVQGGHASTARGVTAATARAHYDNASTAFALVRVGEDAHGIWFSGVPAPGVDPDLFQVGMTCPLSGDWRDCGGGLLDLIAAHAVNSPGFPIYSGLTGPDGRDVALVASFAPLETRAGAMTADDVKAAVREALAESKFDAEKQAALTRAEQWMTPEKTPREQIGELLNSRGLL